MLPLASKIAFGVVVLFFAATTCRLWFDTAVLLVVSMGIKMGYPFAFAITAQLIFLLIAGLWSITRKFFKTL